MSKTMIGRKYDETRILGFFLLVSILLISNTFIVRMNFEPLNNLNHDFIDSFRNDDYPYSTYQDNIRFEGDNSTNQVENRSYIIEQENQFDLRTSQSKSLITPYETNLSIKSRIKNSSFQIYSSSNNDSNDWKNGIEPDYGNVNVTKIFSDEMNFYRLTFRENNQTPASGITNIKFNFSSNPDPINYTTSISFDFCISSLTNELLCSPHTLALEFRFNNASIYFILSDFGSSLGEELEENITKPEGSDSLYILCNDTVPINWRHIDFNISRLITTYFSPDEYPKFSTLETLFCFMFTFLPSYQLTLDLDKLNYFAELPPNGSIEYSIDETRIITSNGTLNYDLIIGNFTITAKNTSPWNESILTYIKINLTRKICLYGKLNIITWNQSHVKIYLNFTIPRLLNNALNSIIDIILPSDWSNLNIINQITNIELLNETYFLNDFISEQRYRINVLESDWIVLEAYLPNYFSNIIAPTDISEKEYIKIRGNLKFPLSGDIDLYLTNNSFIFHQSTLVMINSTFVFPEIEITEQFPLGILELTLNWSNYGEFGLYKKFLYIHEDLSEQYSILFHSPQNFEIYQFDPLLLNLSLLLNGESYESNKTVVFLLKEDKSLLFSCTPYNTYLLNISHIMWGPGNYSLDIIASDEGKFYAREILRLNVQKAAIYWSFENLDTTLMEYENISFRLYSYIYPQNGGVYYILPDLDIKIWINDSLITNYKTNSEGYVDVSFNINDINVENFLYVTIGGILSEKLVKIQNIMFSVTQNSTIENREKAYIQEIARSEILSNSTFYIYYEIAYSSTSSEWYVPLASYSQFIVSAFILRNNYVISAQIDHTNLIWSIEANETIKDTLIIQLPCPIVMITSEKLSTSFRIKIDTYSEIIVNNYTIKIDLHFLGFPFSNLSLLDFLGREIDEIHFKVDNSILTFSGLNIIDNIVISYYLEGNIQNFEVLVHESFKTFYTYNESIWGSWKINNPLNFSFVVKYTIWGIGAFICDNTSLEILQNNSKIISVFLSPQNWNYSLSVHLEVKYYTDFVFFSSIQNITIIDPYEPTFDYSIEEINESIRIHIFVNEPELASGVKNVTLIYKDNIVSVIPHFNNYYIIDIPKNINSSHFMEINVFDNAENKRSSGLIDISCFVSPPKSVLSFLNPQLLIPTIFSSFLIGGIIVARLIRKWKSQII